MKLINEKKKQNPDKLVEFVIPPFNNPDIKTQYSSPFKYNPFQNMNIYQYQVGQYNKNEEINMPMNQEMNMQLNPQINSQLNIQLNSQLNQKMNLQTNLEMNHLEKI